MVCIYHSFLIHSSADGHLGCFHVLAIINSAALFCLLLQCSLLCLHILNTLRIISLLWTLLGILSVISFLYFLSPIITCLAMMNDIFWTQHIFWATIQGLFPLRLFAPIIFNIPFPKLCVFWGHSKSS